MSSGPFEPLFLTFICKLFLLFQVALDLLTVIDNILDASNADSIDCNISSRSFINFLLFLKKKKMF